MRINDDMIEPLVGEILNDVASSFFDARRTLEAKIDLFQNFVEKLEEMAIGVQCRAALLNLLLVNDQQAQAFYRMIGLGSDVFLNAKTADPQDCLSGIPFGISFTSRYTKLVYTVYNDLQVACDVYLNGMSPSENASAKPNQEVVYYHLIVKMHQILNDDIKKINENISPSCALQFAKEFNPGLLAKEKVTGGGISSPKSLDDKLCYRPIDIDNLGLCEYPLPPKLDVVRESVKRFCKDLCVRYPGELKKIVEFIKSRISTTQ